MRKKLILSFMLLMTAVVMATGQSLTVRGSIVDDLGLPVTGATIRFKNDPTKGTQSDLDGRFVLEAPKGEVLVITFVGFARQEVKAAAQLSIVLQPDQELLDEVVVVGYGSGRAKGTTTASVVKVTSKDLESKPSPNVLEGLQGRVSGLDVSSANGEPGQTASIRLHGNGSLGLGSAPLYVLDGVPVGSGAILGLNPNDFESVQVFKDAAATAIYGSRASNGVIFITTKRGDASQKASIVLNAQYGISNLAERSFYDSFLSADELAHFWVESGIKDQKYVDDFRAKYPGDTRWADYFYRKNAPIYSASLSVSGGAGATSYYVSGQHFFQQGLFAGKSEYSKSNLRVNLNTKVNDWLTFFTNNGIYYDNSLSSNSGNSNNINSGLFYVQLPMFSPYKEDGTPYYDELIPGYGHYSPYYIADMTPSTRSTFEYIGNIGLSIRPISGLTLSSNIGLDFAHNFYLNTRDPRYLGNPDDGSRTERYSRGVTWTFTNTAEYGFELGDQHDITLLAGHEYNQYDGTGFQAYGRGLVDHRLMHFDQITDKTTIEVESAGYNGQYAYLSFFGRLSYGLMDRYYLDFTVRNDASSKFPPAHRNATFWSAGLKWNAKSEEFMQGIDWIDRLDVKLSTGTAGNSALGNYAYFATATAGDNYLGKPSRVIGNAGNPSLTWEKQHKTTFGIDAELLRWLGVNLELYHRLTTDMVMSVPFPYTSGVSENDQNVGSYQNVGVDLRLDAQIWKGKKGNYASVYANLNYNRDRIISLFQGNDVWALPKSKLIYQVGQPIMFYMPIFKQVNPDNGAPEWYNPGTNRGYRHTDGSDITVGNAYNSEALMQSTGIPRYAPWRGGWGFSARYGSFFVSADFAFVLGKYMVSNDLIYSDNPNRAKNNRNISYRALNYWKKPGDHVIIADIKKYNSPIVLDTRTLLNSSYMRLKSLSVGYDMPKELLSKQSFFTGAKVSLTGRNLWTISRFIGPDPEPETNLSYGRNPNSMQVVGSIELKF